MLTYNIFVFQKGYFKYEEFIFFEKHNTFLRLGKTRGDGYRQQLMILLVKLLMVYSNLFNFSVPYIEKNNTLFYGGILFITNSRGESNMGIKLSIRTSQNSKMIKLI